MTLYDDDVLRIEGIVRKIAKEEIEPVVEATSKKLETKIKDLEEKLVGQIRNLITEQAELKRELRRPEKSAGKIFSKK